MSKEKVSSQEIIDILASKASISKRASEEFIKVMISTIEEALIAGDIVKIKNFGTFKLHWNEPRKSVNVQTGESIILAGYHKVTFTPDSNLRDLVNEPFNHLEAVNLDALPTENITSGVEPSQDPLRTLNEQAFEIKNILDEINELSIAKDNVVVNNDEQNDLLEQAIIDSASDEDIVSVTANDVVQMEDQNKVEPVEVVPSVSVANSEPITNAQEVDSDNLTTIPLIKSKKHKKTLLWIFFSVFIIVSIGTGAYLSIPQVRSFVDKTYSNSKISVLKKSESFSFTEMINTISGWFSSKPQKQDIPVVVFIPKDTLAIDSLQPKLKVDSLQQLFDNPRVFNSFLATVPIKPNSRLTNMSKHYYGNKIFWVYIYEANREKINDPDNIKVGTMIRIPKLDPRLIDSSNQRCVKKAIELHDLYVK